MKLWAVAAAVLALNIPFGYWRATTRKFSWQWILAVHLPVPAVIAMRILSGLGWQLMSFPVLIGALFLGQFSGGRLKRLWSGAAGRLGLVTNDYTQVPDPRPSGYGGNPSGQTMQEP